MKSDPLVGNKCPQGQKAESLGEEVQVCSESEIPVIKEQLETNEVFDTGKKINVTEYAGKIGEDDGCSVTAVYELDDLIKWGKYGVNYTLSSMSMTEFVNCFGYVLFPENFALDEYGQLCFDGFFRIDPEENLPQEPEDTGEEVQQASESFGKSAEKRWISVRKVLR